jgi:uncharacterized membrane protein YeaQ/YmgE (transglycosylase-associated protein family)
MQTIKTKKPEQYQQVKWSALIWFVIGAAVIITVGMMLK